MTSSFQSLILEQNDEQNTQGSRGYDCLMKTEDEHTDKCYFKPPPEPCPRKHIGRELETRCLDWKEEGEKDTHMSY